MKHPNYTSAAAVMCGFSLQFVSGAGIAVFKEQPYHSDSSATPVIYAKVLDSVPTAVRFDLGGKEASYDRSKFVTNIDIPEFPEYLRSEQEAAPLRQWHDNLKSFAERFPKTSKILQPYIESYSKALARLQNGEVRYSGSWISASAYAVILKKHQEEEAMQKQQAMAYAEEMRIQQGKRESYAKAQREKGLEEYKGQWLSASEVRKLIEEDKKRTVVWDKIQMKSIFDSEYEIFQVLDNGVLFKPISGNVKQGGLALDIAYLSGVNTNTAAVGDQYIGDLFWCGTYSYHTKGGRDTTVNSYCLKKEAAIQKVGEILFGNPENSGDSSVANSPPKRNSPNSDIPEPLKGALSSGSGFFVGNEGYFITNAHVVEGANDVKIYYSGKTLEAEIIKVSKVADLALMKVPLQITGLEIEEIEAAPGDDVLAIGYPQPTIQGLEAKVTKGVISSSKGLDEDDTRFQIDAAVQPGNSGGPLCNSNGTLVGVVVAALNQIAVAARTGSIPQNVNYAIKASEVIALLRTKSVNYQTGQSESKTSANSSPITQAVKKSALVIVR